MIRTTIVSPFIHGKHEDLITPPVLIRVNDFNELSVKTFSEDMEKAHNTGQTIIPLIIDSYGGEVYGLLDMISQIQNSKLPVHTIVMGKAMSCGSLLFSCGQERYMSPYATLVVHDMTAACMGKTADLKSASNHIDELSKKIFSIMSKNIGKKEDFIHKMLHEKSHTEWYINAPEAKKYNICTHIGTPELKTEITLNYKFGINV